MIEGPSFIHLPPCGGKNILQSIKQSRKMHFISLSALHAFLPGYLPMTTWHSTQDLRNYYKDTSK